MASATTCNLLTSSLGTRRHNTHALKILTFLSKGLPFSVPHYKTKSFKQYNLRDTNKPLSVTGVRCMCFFLCLFHVPRFNISSGISRVHTRF